MNEKERDELRDYLSSLYPDIPEPDLDFARSQLQKAESLEAAGSMDEAAQAIEQALDQFDDWYYSEAASEWPDGMMEYLLLKEAACRLHAKRVLSNQDGSKSGEADEMHEELYSLLCETDSQENPEYRRLQLRAWEECGEWELRTAASDSGAEAYGKCLDAYERLLQENPDDQELAKEMTRLVDKLLELCADHQYDLYLEDELTGRITHLLEKPETERTKKDDFKTIWRLGKLADLYERQVRDLQMIETLKQQIKVYEKYEAEFSPELTKQYLKSVLRVFEAIPYVYSLSDGLFFLQERLQVLDQLPSNPNQPFLRSSIEQQMIMGENRLKQMKKEVEERRQRLAGFEDLENPSIEAEEEMYRLYSELACKIPEFRPVEEAVPILEKAQKIACKMDQERPDQKSKDRLFEIDSLLQHYRNLVQDRKEEGWILKIWPGINDQALQESDAAKNGQLSFD